MAKAKLTGCAFVLLFFVSFIAASVRASIAQARPSAYRKQSFFHSNHRHRKLVFS